MHLQTIPGIKPYHTIPYHSVHLFVGHRGQSVVIIESEAVKDAMLAVVVNEHVVLRINRNPRHRAL